MRQQHSTVGLALCLAACLAVCCLAALEPQYKGGDYNYEQQYMKQAYGSWGYREDEDADGKPSCGPKQFKELTGATCIDPHSGKCVEYDEDECKASTTGWCKRVPGTEWACTYAYKRRGELCREADGVCDSDDYCTGTSATCTDKVKAAGLVCLKSDAPCILDAKCNGTAKACPVPRNAANGHPCADDGLYEEAHESGKLAYAEDPKVAGIAAVPAEHAEKHGWSTCHRCHKGECVAFKFEWWAGKKKAGGKHVDRSEGYEPKSDDWHEDWYSSKVDLEAAAMANGFEPKVYCKRRVA